MNFYSNFSKVDPIVLKQIGDALTELKRRLSTLDIANLGISEYNQKYLANHVKEFEKAAWFLSHIFLLICEKQNDLSKVTIVDYGGGSGIVSYFARLLGIGTIVYNDIYNVSCDDVKIISDKLNCKIDYIVEGDVNKVVDFINSESLNFDYLIAQDVIEHIYNVEQWYIDLQKLQCDNFNIICTSHANKYNYLINRKFGKIQKNVEQFSRQKQWGHKERDSLHSFYDIRKGIIQENFNSLTDSEIAKLAKVTRGQIKEDILATIDNYIETGQLNYKPNHKTNTCDPLTGNWIEQFIDLKQLMLFLSNNRYCSELTAGFYISSKGSTIVKLIKILVNYVIKILGFKGLHFAPYYLILSTFNKSGVYQE